MPDSPLLASFVQARNYTPGPRLGSIDYLVVHDMEYPEKLTAAEDVARFFANQAKGTSGSSAHVCVDPDSIVGCVHDADIAWHAPGANHNGLGCELAGYARQTAAEWADPYSDAMLRRAAGWFADRAKAYGIAIAFRTGAELAAAASSGRRLTGITTHHEVTKAFKRGTHTDPGPNFPMGRFLSYISAAGASSPQEGTMQMFHPTSGPQSGSIFLVMGDLLTGVPSPTEFNELAAAGVAVHEIGPSAWKLLWDRLKRV